MYRRIYFFFLLAACSSLPIHESLNQVKIGMDKSSVLDIAGNPTHTFRSQSQDHWLYRYYRDDHRHSRDVVFEEGRVVSIGSERAQAEKLDSDADLHSLEEKVRARQKQNEADFEDVQ